jgi:hypothetical protein
MKLAISLAAAGLLLSPAAFAQTPHQSATSTPPGQQTVGAELGKAGLQKRVTQDLQKAGFTDVSVTPDSFLVRAKDRSGDPVAMIVGPNSMTAIVAQTSSGTSSGGAADPASSPDAQGTMFTTVPSTDRLSSEVVGLDVYNGANKDIGTIKDIAYAGADVKAYILSVGGFLGMGDRYVAVSPSDLKVTYDANAKKWQAKMDTTADQLKSAPAFNYSNKA